MPLTSMFPDSTYHSGKTEWWRVKLNCSGYLWRQKEISKEISKTRKVVYCNIIYFHGTFIFADNTFECVPETRDSRHKLRISTPRTLFQLWYNIGHIIVELLFVHIESLKVILDLFEQYNWQNKNNTQRRPRTTDTVLNISKLKN